MCDYEKIYEIASQKYDVIVADIVSNVFSFSPNIVFFVVGSFPNIFTSLIFESLLFISEFLPAFVPKINSKDYLKNGKVSFLPTVNSDKSQIDGLVVNLYAKSSIPNGKGGFKTYAELTDSEIEQEM